jgi:hypothetical protein
MDYRETESKWAERSKRFLKAELKRAGVTYEELARRLREHAPARKPSCSECPPAGTRKGIACRHAVDYRFPSVAPPAGALVSAK